MQEIGFINAHDKYCIKISKFKKDIAKLLKLEKSNCGEISIIFADNKTLKELNNKYRNKNSATDVLSFNLNEEDFLGEIYISLEKVKEQAKEFKIPFYNELWRLIVHGIFHLLGYDHESEKEAKIMEKKEARYLYD